MVWQLAGGSCTQSMHKLLRFILLPFGLVMILFCSGGCASIAGGYRVPDGTTKSRGYSSIAGEVDVGRRANVGDLNTVAGEIDIGEGSRVRSADSVAGRIRLAEGVTVDRSVETIAGDIDIDRGCTIGGNVGTVAGEITIGESVVKGDVILRRGELKLTGTRVLGVVRVKYARDDEERIPEIRIGPNSEVGGVEVAEKMTVHLRIHRSAKVGAVKGAQAEYYD